MSARDIGLLSGLTADDIQYLMDRPDEAAPPHVAAMITLWVHSREVGRQRALLVARSPVAEELWLPIPGYLNYSVSSLGSVRRETGANGHTPLRRLKQSPDRDGYLRVTLYSRSKGKQRVQVQRLVCLAFHGPPRPRRKFACHRNGQQQDNRAENLYWGTARDNAQDAVRHASERASNLRTEPRKTARSYARKTASLVQNPYKGLTTNQIRELYALKKISKSKAIELIEKRLGRS